MTIKKTALPQGPDQIELTDMAFRKLTGIGVDPVTAQFKIGSFPPEFLIEEVDKLQKDRHVRSPGKYILKTLTIDGYNKWKNDQFRKKQPDHFFKQPEIVKTPNKTPGDFITSLRIYWLLKWDYQLTDYRDVVFSKSERYEKGCKEIKSAIHLSQNEEK